MYKNEHHSSREIPSGQDEHIRCRLCVCRRYLAEINQAAIFSYSCIFFACISYCLQLFGHAMLSRWVLMGVFVIYGYSGVCAILQSFRGVNAVKLGTAWQMFWISFLFSLLWDLSVRSPMTFKGHYTVLLVGTISLNLTTVLWLLTIIVQENIFKHILNFIKSNILIIFLIGIYFVLSFSVVYNWPKIDSIDYYSSILKAVRWDFTFKTFDTWKLCSHNSFGYTLFAVIGEYLWPGDGKGVRLMQIVLVCISIGAFSGIIRKLKLDHRSKFENVLITSMFAFTPLILGTVFEMAADLPMACFFVWLLYSYLTGNKVFMLASVFLLIFSKEPAILILLGFGIGWVFVTFFSFGRKNGFFAFFRQKSFWYQIACLGLPALFFVVAFVFSSQWTGRAGASSSSFSAQGNQLFSFGINLDNIFVKCKEFTAMNFSWLILAVTVVSLLYCLIYKKKNWCPSDNTKNFVWLHLLSADACFFIFNLIYITFCNPRYLTPFFAVLPIFLACAIYALSKKLRISICAVIATLLLIQNFVTIDPVMLSAFKNIDIGNGTIITTRTFMLNADGTLYTGDEAASNNELSHGASYNREYSYISSLMEKALAEINYDNDTLIIIAPTYNQFMTRLTFLGDRVNDREYYYNRETKRLTYDETQTHINYFIPANSTDSTSFDNYQRVYILYFPYREQYYHVDSLLEQYEILDSFSVDCHRWVVNIYQVK